MLVSKNTEERMFVVDSGASMHMLSNKDLSSDEMDTLRRSRTPTTVVTANCEVQTNEEVQVYVQDLDLFVTVQFLEETPAILLLHQLCSERGYSYEWKTAKLHNWPRMRKQLLVQWTTSYLLSYQDCHHLPAAARLLHRDQRISPIRPVNPKQHQIQ